MRRLRGLSLLVACTVCCLLGGTLAEGATRYDPRLRFRTISTPRFDIHFHQGEDAIARRLAGFVEAAAAEVDRAVGAAVGRVQIVLVDQHDLPNGWATPLPYNTIEISAAAPAADSLIGNTDDWLRLVFIHEYTHVAHLSRAGGWIGGLRRGFGRLPVLFPNLYQPLWGIEGIATWQESVSTRQGRVPAGDFRQLVEGAASAGRFEPIDRANGGNVDWPSGATPYVYGAYFHVYLANQYGAESLRTLAAETGRRLPYLGSRAYKKVFGRSLGELWDEFEKATTVQAREDAPPFDAVRLTHHGFDVSGPRYAPDGRVFYSARSPHHFPAVMEIGGSGETRRVATRYLGTSIGWAGDLLVLDEIEVAGAVSLRSDLYRVDPRNGSSRRLTHGARAASPDVSRSGVVVCTVQFSDRRALATFPLPGVDGTVTPTILISEAWTDFSSPRWSPDSRLIAAERRRLGSGSQIVVVDPADGTVRVVADLPGGRSAAPTWTPDGQRLLFSAAVGAEPFQIYSVTLAGGAIARLEGAGPSAQSPDVSPDGRSLVYVGYTADGYDLFSISLSAARWTPWSPSASVQDAGSTGVPADVAPAPRSYSPWPTLPPQFWTPTVESDAGELVVGAASGSADVLGRHAYGIEAGWSTRGRPDWQAAYAYDRWRPTVFVAVADDTDPWRSGDVRTREADVGVLGRVPRVRFSHTTLASFHVSRGSFSCMTCEPAVAEDRVRASLRAGWLYSSARSFGYSISAEEGQRLSVTAETTRAALGADGNGVALTLDGRSYWRAGPRRHSVVALRAAAAGSWGDREAERHFSAGGSGPAAGIDFGTDAIALLRGFSSGELLGTRAVVVNGDLRVPVARIDRGLGTVPVFVRSIHGAIFVDAGNAWEGGIRWSDVRLAAGVELSVDTVVGFALPVTFTAGASWRRDGAEGARGVVAFGRIGRAF